MSLSPLQEARYTYKPKLPKALTQEISTIALELGEPTKALADAQAVESLFPHTYGKPIAKFLPGKGRSNKDPMTVGVILSGGQAPGGHNVITGLFDGLKKLNPANTLLGFLGGPSGLIDDKALELTDSIIDQYRNTGGFDIIGSGRTKIETPEQFAKVLETAKRRNLQAVVVIGGDDSNTNAALLAEYFLAQGTKIQVIGVPKTIDGDLKNQYIETSFGFDTACKTYSELIGNIARDANSAKKYWHFIKLMGRSASHIALECALQTRPNIAIISEEVEAKQQSLADIVEQIAKVIMHRGEHGEHFGIALIPEGLIEFIPEMKVLISELNDLLAHEEQAFSQLKTLEDQSSFVSQKLTPSSAKAFNSLPAGIRAQLMADRDPHGNVQVSLIDTEKLLIQMVGEFLSEKKKTGEYKGKFSALAHFFGYEGRCAFPSNFDADYCYSLGFTGCLLIAQGLTGYLSSVRNLSLPADQWIAGGIPLTMMMNMEKRHGKDKPVIRKALVELDGAPFKELQRNRDQWAIQTSFRFPGAIQYYGPSQVCDQPTLTLGLEAANNKN